MDASGAEDGTDFRPFFDMVIGILFVLLILVAAQIYFQQAQVDGAASDVAKREIAMRRADIAAFLDALASRLRAGGLAATADGGAGAVLLPLREIMVVDHNGLPTTEGGPADQLGAALAELTGCVTLPRNPSPVCSAYVRLSLDALAVTMRVGALPSGAALPRDRFGDLGSALLSAKLMADHPELVGASNAVGGRVVNFGTAPTGATPPVAQEPGMGGDLVLDFTFR